MSTPPAADVHRTRDTAVPEPSSEELDALLRELSAQPPGQRRAALRDQVIRRLLPMARRVSRRFQRHGEDFDDLLQVASLGLIKAVDGYDPALGHAFLSYALPKVTGELRRHLRDRTATVRLPRPFQEASGRILNAVEELEQRFGGCSPTTEQIAAHTGLGQERVRSALRAVHACRTRSLDEPAGQGEGSSLACLVGAEDPALDRVVDTVALAALVRQLPERDRRVLYLRFYRERTQQQIAEAVGVSQMQVSRILRRCLDRLRGALLTGESGPGAGTRGPLTVRPARPSRPATTASAGTAPVPGLRPTTGPRLRTPPAPQPRHPDPARPRTTAAPTRRPPSSPGPPTAPALRTWPNPRSHTPADTANGPRPQAPAPAGVRAPHDPKPRHQTNPRFHTPADTAHRTPPGHGPQPPATTQPRTPTDPKPRHRTDPRFRAPADPPLPSSAATVPPAPAARKARSPAGTAHRTATGPRLRALSAAGLRSPDGAGFRCRWGGGGPGTAVSAGGRRPRAPGAEGLARCCAPGASGTIRCSKARSGVWRRTRRARRAARPPPGAPCTRGTT
ncbi:MULTISPECIES: sigma-70 family RNA polymerase sigma factor [unclassified Streptomyces]|uniref:sigma-70 family RNA polymerase sigma factor n=1 Tax=unclassified Streptomyces TaxID=2593676 RepID=UPI000AC756C4|nr:MULTISPECIES: sigma-70 family RNA polymerase sigma factor [unclassified Streptomyces]